MILRKNISLNEEYLKKLEPLMQKHSGNLSAVIREVIDLADAAFQDPDSVKRLISGLKKEQNLTSLALSWALKNTAGRLPDEEVVHNIFGNGITSISLLEKRLNELAGEIYWGSSVKINADDERHPANAAIVINGKNQNMNRFLACLISVYTARKYNLGVAEVNSVNNHFEINMKRGDQDWISRSLMNNFGSMDYTLSELYKKPDFWNTIVSLYAKMNYEMVAISRQSFDEIMGGNITPKITAYFEKFFGCPINQIPLEDLLNKIKMLYQPMGLIESIEINKNSLIIHHGIKEPKAIEKLTNIFLDLLKSAGHVYSSEISENLIVLKHRSEIDKILSRMLEDLKAKKIPLKDYHLHLMKMLDMLKNVSYDNEIIKSSGSEFGGMMLCSYEKENRIGRWDVNNLVKYLQEVSNVLTQDANWEIVSDNVIHGRIIACPLVKGDGRFNPTSCAFIQEIFDASIAHAFGKQSERIHKTYTKATDKNVACEIYVAV